MTFVLVWFVFISIIFLIKIISLTKQVNDLLWDNKVLLNNYITAMNCLAESDPKLKAYLENKNI